MDKAFIIQEIKRTTDANGGAPLGWRRFFNETGIKQSDWSGVYWTRWNDALREAGFGPNQLTEAYSKAQLLQMFAELAVQLGRLPVNGDLRIKARNEPGFPSDSTFRRLGTKSEFVGLLLGHCRNIVGFEDVVRYCEQYAPNKRETADDAGRPSDDTFGHVYLMKSGRFYKLGKSNAAGRRHRELAIQLPEKVKMVHVISTDDPNGIEAYWHKRFDAKRMNGEWFNLGADDVRAFKRRKFM